MQTVAKKQQIPRSVDDLIEEAVANAQPGLSLTRIASDLIDENFSAFEAVIRQWAVEHIVRLLRRKSRQQAASMQLVLPGFEALPARIPRSDGKGRRALLRATYEDLRVYHGLLLTKVQESPRVVQLEKLMALMRQYRVKGITVQEVLEREGIERRLPE